MDMSSKRKWAFVKLGAFIVVVVLLVAGGRILVLRKKQRLTKAPVAKFAEKSVDTVRAVRGDLTEHHDYLAWIEPIRTSQISARVTAHITQILHEEGDQVKKGERLVLLDDRDMRDAIAIAKAQIGQAQAELEVNETLLKSLRKTTAYWQAEAQRDSKLAAKGAIPEAQAQATLEKYNVALGKERSAEQRSQVIRQQILTLKVRIKELETRLSYYTITAPFNGTVSARMVDPGDLAVPGKPLLTLEDTSAIKLAFDIPQVDLSFIKVGMAGSFSYEGKTYQAKISRIYPKLNQAHMVRAEALLPATLNSRLPLGAYVTCSVNFVTLKNEVLIPIRALIDMHDQYYVFVVEHGTLKRHGVQVLGTACDKVAVRGIDSGAEVVVHSFLGWANLSDGLKVETR